MQRAFLLGSGVAALLLIGAGGVVVWQTADTAPERDTAALSAEPPPPPTRPTPSPKAAPAVVAPSFDVVKVSPNGNAVIAGHAAPGAKVTVLDGGKPVGTVTADRGGDWVLLPAAPLPPGQQQLALQAIDPATGAAVNSDATVMLTRPAAEPGAGETTTAVLVPHDADKPPRTLQAPTAAAPLALGSVDYDAAGRVTLAGRARPGATVRLYAGGEPLATATADASGAWSATPTRVLPPGRYELRLDEIGPDGTVAQRLTQPFERAVAALTPGQSYVVQPGNNLWRIARRAYGAGTRYTVIYSANSGKIRDPEKIYPGQIFALPK